MVGQSCWYWPFICGLALVVVPVFVRLAGWLASPFPKPSAKSELDRHGIYGLMRHPLHSMDLLTLKKWV